jgi:ribose/xylose/arabinose/galactoside ABC-type transport system permease subunit
VCAFEEKDMGETPVLQMTTLSYEPVDAATTGRRFGWRDALASLGPLIGLAFVFALFSVLTPRTFLTLDNMQLMLLQTAVVGTAALGMTLIIISGGIDLSVGSTIALCTVVIAMLLNAGVPPWLAAVGGIGAGTACGALIGGLVTGLDLAPFIVTLGTFGAYRGVAKQLAHQQMVLAPDTWLNSLLTTLGADNRWMLLPTGVGMMLVLAVVVACVLRYTRFGRHTFAVGSNEQTARLCGVGVGRTKLFVYGVAGALAGVAGVLQFSFLTVGDPTTANGYELSIIAAVVIGGASLSGGQGSVLGALLGALFMTVVANGCTKVGLDNPVQEIVTGGIIVVAAFLDRLRRRRERA